MMVHVPPPSGMRADSPGESGTLWVSQFPAVPQLPSVTIHVDTGPTATQTAMDRAVRIVISITGCELRLYVAISTYLPERLICDGACAATPGIP